MLVTFNRTPSAYRHKTTPILKDPRQPTGTGVFQYQLHSKLICYPYLSYLDAQWEQVYS